jgi:hypothetical protein
MCNSLYCLIFGIYTYIQHDVSPIIPSNPHAHSRQSHTLDLDWDALGQLVNRDAAPGRLVREELLVHGVHLGEVVHGGQEHVDLDDLVERGPRGREHRAEVLDAQLRHLRDARRRLREDLAAGRAGDLARAVDRVGGAYGLGLGPLLGEGMEVWDGRGPYVGTCSLGSVNGVVFFSSGLLGLRGLTKSGILGEDFLVFCCHCGELERGAIQDS